MRAVILLNPSLDHPVEHASKGRAYADASLGFDYHGAIDDQPALARHLRELADLLEAKPVPDPDFF